LLFLPEAKRYTGYALALKDVLAKISSNCRFAEVIRLPSSNTSCGSSLMPSEIDT
jgi:hypothetical protein